MMKKYLNILFSIGFLTAIGSTLAMAIPRVYQCHIIDYVGNKEVKTNFQYTVAPGYRSFKSNHSEVRFSYTKEAILYSSIRPLNNVGIYARREDKGSPLQIALTHIAKNYGATLRCSM